MPERTDDLTALFRRHQQDTGLLYGEGKLVSWNPETLENEVEFRGAVIRNLRIAASGFDALTWAPNDLVELRGYAPRHGSAVWWIGNRIITPGAGAAGVLLASMQADLAKAISAQVFAERVHIATLGAVVEDHTSLSYEDGPGTLDGPSVEVDITEGGFAIVTLSVSLRVSLSAGGTHSQAGGMSFDVFGPSGQLISPANDLSAYRVNISGDTGLNVLHRTEASRTVISPIVSGQPATFEQAGQYTFIARYKSADAARPVSVANPTIEVIGF